MTMLETDIRKKIIDEEELRRTQDQFFKMLYVDFGLNINRRFKQWYKMSWEEFKKELTEQRGKLNDCMLYDWEQYFKNSKQKIQALMG